jgi:hypothetical protein
MKVTIELSADQVKGIKAYLNATGSEIRKATNKDVKEFFEGEALGLLDCGAVADYITHANY